MVAINVFAFAPKVLPTVDCPVELFSSGAQ